ncbi:aquaporin TIP4-1 [Gracilaria domingensis]|nr:aquaporin TIP4-1 [Gracilaria domingensis]
MGVSKEPTEQTALLEKDPETEVHTSAPMPEQQMPGLVSRSKPLDARVIFAEFLCTFLFVYLSVTSTQQAALANTLNNACIIAALAASFMPVSGAHLNPAVTLALLATDRAPLSRSVVFVLVQLLASISACLLARFLGVAIVFQGVTGGMTELIRAFFAEFMPMFIIVMVVFQTAVATEDEGGVGPKIAAMYIGFAVLACAGTFPGIFNPARAFGPAFVTGVLDGHWVYWAGPLLGALTAALVSDGFLYLSLFHSANSNVLTNHSFCMLKQMSEHLFIAPATGRKPKGWLSYLSRKASNAGKNLKSFGIAGLVAYGIMNTVYYGTVFSFMLLRFVEGLLLIPNMIVHYVVYAFEF